MKLFSRLFLTSVAVLGLSMSVAASSFTISTSFNSGADSLAIAPQYGPGGPMQFASYTTNPSSEGYSALNLAGLQMTSSPSGLSSYSGNFQINVTIKEDGTANIGTIVLDDSVIGTASPLLLANPSAPPYGYSFSVDHDLKLDPSSGSPVFSDGQAVDIIVGGTLFTLELSTFNSYSIDGDQPTKDMPGPYVAMYAQASAVPEPSTALLLAGGLVVSVIRKRMKGLPAL